MKLETLKFLQQVNLIQRIPLGTPLQELVMPLPHKYVTLGNVGSKNNFLIEFHRALVHYG